jgi:hypothetical protein
MLQITNDEITGFSITGNIGADFYAAILPLTHASGIPFWILDQAGQEIFIDSDGTAYHLRRRTQAEIDALTAIPFDQAQADALTAWNQQVNVFITHYFDTGTQISFVKLYIQSEAARPLINQVDAWTTAVMAFYYQVKAAIQAATTLEDLTILQDSLEFDSRFGLQGSVLAVPDVRLAQFF